MSNISRKIVLLISLRSKQESTSNYEIRRARMACALRRNATNTLVNASSAPYGACFGRRPKSRIIPPMIVENASTIVGKNVYIAPTSYVGGAVTLGDDVTVMHHVCIRGDVSHIRIGRRVNVQDGTVIHTHSGVDLDIEDDVSIGHRAVVHCTRVMAGSLIGIGSIVLDGSVIGRHCLVAAGALVPPNTIVPDGKVIMGVPGKIVRDVTAQEREYMAYVVRNYMELGRRHAAGEYACAAAGPQSVRHD